MKRVIIIVLDGVGIGELPDAGLFSDSGADTLGNVARAIKGFHLPNLEAYGLGCIKKIKQLSPIPSNKTKAYGKCMEKSSAKDTVIGHWEITGIISSKPFPLFPQGFPQDFIEAFEKKIKRKILGNKAASGTEIINELGSEHIKTGFPIVYTSADSVFQIAAHKDVIGVDELYKMCSIARSLLKGPLGVGRVIARPFEGKEKGFVRTPERKDFSLPPPQKTLLDIIKEKGLNTFGIGKIYDIFAGHGLTDYEKTVNNLDGLEKTLKIIKSQKDFSLIFTNLVDTDMLYGHRRDVKGFYKALKEIDSFLPEIINACKNDDILIITADHGCDPAFSGTDHTREYVPLLVIGKKIKHNINLGVRETLADIAATIAEYLNISYNISGKSFLSEILTG